MIFTTAEISTIKVKYKVIKSCLSEKGKRLWAAAEVKEEMAWHGGYYK